MAEEDIYDLEKAVDLVRGGVKEKFDSTVELHVRLGIDPKRSEWQVRGALSFPHSFGRPKKILAFTSDPESAIKAGAAKAGSSAFIKEIKDSGKCDFDIVVGEPQFMKELAAVSKILGPKGLMPSPKNETVSEDIPRTITQILKGRVSYKNDDAGNLHLPVGKVSFSAVDLVENLKYALEQIKRARPQGFKGSYIKKIVVCSTMGKGVKVKVQ